MYNAQTLIKNIKLRAKAKNTLISDMLNDCGLNINTISQISDKKGMSSFSLARIADYLDCSVDYLLGRTDMPVRENLNGVNGIDRLNAEGKKLVDAFAEMLINSGKYQQDGNKNQ